MSPRRVRLAIALSTAMALAVLVFPAIAGSTPNGGGTSPLGAAGPTPQRQPSWRVWTGRPEPVSGASPGAMRRPSAGHSVQSLHLDGHGAGAAGRHAAAFHVDKTHRAVGEPSTERATAAVKRVDRSQPHRPVERELPCAVASDAGRCP